MSCNNISTADFSLLCRICLQPELDMKYLFHGEAANMLNCGLFMEVYENDGLPAQICNKCEQELIQSYAFKEKCSIAQNTLKIKLEQDILSAVNESNAVEDEIAIKNEDIITIKTEVITEDEDEIMDNELNIKEEITTEDEETVKQATRVESNLLPAKSAKAYEKLYSQLMDWRDKNKVSSFSESVLMVYFDELSKKLKSTSLWTHYSILKSTLSIKHKVDISKYSKLNALLKRNSEGYKPKKAKTFSTNEVKQFIGEAPDVKYLLCKVACIFGIIGACRRRELHKLEFKDVNDFEPTLLVTIKDAKTKTTRTFTVTGKYYEICKKYMNLRPVNCVAPAFFVNYVNGKCTAQNVGINKFGNMGKQIATYLNLPDPSLYTGHCFRRSSATILVDAGGDITPRGKRNHSGDRQLH